MKCPVSLVVLILPIIAVANAWAQQVPDADLIQNPAGREFLDLDGDWRIIPDPYENGYYNHRYEPRADGYFEARKHDDPTELIEYDFRRSQVLEVPGDWNSQDERYFFYEGTMWYFRTFEVEPKKNHRYLLHFGGVNYFANVWLNGRHLGQQAAATARSVG
jgi:beta-glucuronidase